MDGTTAWFLGPAAGGKTPDLGSEVSDRSFPSALDAFPAVEDPDDSLRGTTGGSPDADVADEAETSFSTVLFLVASEISGGEAPLLCDGLLAAVDPDGLPSGTAGRPPRVDAKLSVQESEFSNMGSCSSFLIGNPAEFSSKALIGDFDPKFNGTPASSSGELRPDMVGKT